MGGRLERPGIIPAALSNFLLYKYGLSVTMISLFF
jgi:hypothetical protein